MIKSMTGYGRGVYEGGMARLTVELRSVNSRFMELNIKQPRQFMPLEDRLRRLLKARVHRGKLDCFVNYEPLSAELSFASVNHAAAAAYKNALMEINQRYTEGEGGQGDIFRLLAENPHVISLSSRLDDDNLGEIWSYMRIAAAAAADQLDIMRVREGQNLADSIVGKIDALNGAGAAIRGMFAVAIENYRARLYRRMSEVLKDAAVDEQRILAEAAIYAEKVDIDEELTRLFSHISQARALVHEGGIIGKKLDFLTQELLREANTMGAKLNDPDVVRHVITLKNNIEMIKEQAMNLE